MLAHMPSLSALQSNDDDRLGAELQLARLRSQVAVVRTIADEVEHLTRPRDADGVRAQLVEEMARLGCRLLEAAASLTEPPRSEDSGVFARPPSFGFDGLTRFMPVSAFSAAPPSSRQRSENPILRLGK